MKTVFIVTDANGKYQGCFETMHLAVETVKQTWNTSGKKLEFSEDARIKVCKVDGKPEHHISEEAVYGHVDHL